MTITSEMVVFFLTVVGALAGVWWRIEAQINKAKSELSTTLGAVEAKASLTAVQLAEYKIHVAETYISKSGHRDANQHVMDALADMKSAIDGINTRIDRVLTPPRRAE